jgi:hypothetical protein
MSAISVAHDEQPIGCGRKPDWDDRALPASQLTRHIPDNDHQLHLAPHPLLADAGLMMPGGYDIFVIEQLFYKRCPIR